MYCSTYSRKCNPYALEKPVERRYELKERYAKLAIIAVISLILWLGIRFFLPIFLPFFLGGALAFAAEPLTVFLCRRLRLPRSAAVGISVSAAFCFFLLLVLLLGALILRELGVLAGALPDLGETARAGLSALSQRLVGIAGKAPAGLQAYLTDSIQELFSGSTALLDRAVGYLLNLAGGILSHLPDSALALGTAIISGYMIAAKLPVLRERWHALGSRGQHLAAVVLRMKQVLLRWLLAQLKLCGISWCILTLGFLLLRISQAPLWAFAVAMVDAFPILGTGTVLIPWSVFSFLQGDNARAIGLLGIYGAVSLIRSVLEPRLVGKQLGLDPLVTLFSLYAGYKLWGLAGMLLAPLLAVAATQVFPPGTAPEPP